MGWAFASGCRLGCFCPVFEEENCNILCTLEFLSLRPCLWLLQWSSIGRHEDSRGRMGRLEQHLNARLPQPTRVREPLLASPLCSCVEFTEARTPRAAFQLRALFLDGFLFSSFLPSSPS